MLHKEELNKTIKAHQVEWVTDKIHKGGIKVDIKILNRWDSTDSLKHNKWPLISNPVIMGKCTAGRFQGCRHRHHIWIIMETQSWLVMVLMANPKE